MNPLLIGLPAIVVIPLAVQAAKELGLPSRYAPLAAVIFGMLYELGASPDIVTWLTAGPFVGLAAVGGYSSLRSAVKPAQPPPGAE